MNIVMMGTGSFAEPTFRQILDGPHSVVGLVTQPNRATGKERGSTRQPGQPMKELAIARHVPVLQPESINTSEGIESLRRLAPDLLVVAAYGQILSKDVLGVPRLGGINVHASLLPKYRGAAPINWAIYHGETRTGVTIIRMSAALDAGDVLAQEATEILPDETAGELEARLGPLGARLALDVVNRLAAGPVQGKPQDKSQVTRAPKLTKEHGLIDWSRPAVTVCDQVRAMQPWPTAYAYLHRGVGDPPRLMIQRVAVTSERPAIAALPGALATDHAGHRLWARCGDGTWIEIAELQPAGKRRMTAAEFLRGHPIGPDARFGSESV
jgi:methionyl-tRNA formyltransferase